MHAVLFGEALDKSCLCSHPRLIRPEATLTRSVPCACSQACKRKAASFLWIPPRINTFRGGDTGMRAKRHVLICLEAALGVLLRFFQEMLRGFWGAARDHCRAGFRFPGSPG